MLGTLCRARARDGLDESSCVGVGGAIENVVDGAALDDLAAIQDVDAVDSLARDREVVRDEEVGEPELLAQPREQVEDLRLDRDVERRHRLVADDDLGLDREGPCDRDALALAAGKRDAACALR